MDGARIGKNCTVYPGAVISANPQDLKYKNEKTFVEIVHQPVGFCLDNQLFICQIHLQIRLHVDIMYLRNSTFQAPRMKARLGSTGVVKNYY